MAKKRGVSDRMKSTTVKDCGDCTAMCCHDLTIDIKKPRTRHEIETVKWQLHYENVAVYIRNKRWHLIVKSKCQYLGDDNLCTKYEIRDEICRKHMPPNCERFGQWYDRMITAPDDLEAFLKASREGKRPPRPKGPAWRSKGN